jgi:PAS domain S-box-containing protein
VQSLSDLGPVVAYCEHTGEAFFAVDRDWRVVTANAHALRYSGWRLEDALGRSYWEIIPSDENRVNEALFREAMVASAPFVVEVPSRLYADRQLRAVFIPLRDGLAVSFRDITEQRAADRERERQRVERESRLRLALDATELGTWDFNPRTRDLTWDERCRTVFGVPPDRTVSYEAFVEMLHPSDRAEVLAAVTRALDPAGTGELTLEHRITDFTTGAVKWIAGRGQAFFADGHAHRLIGTVMDITARRTVEQALRESEERLRTIADNIPNGMVYQMIRNPDGDVRFTYVSQAVERLHGVRAEDVLADSEVLDRQVLEGFRPELERLQQEADPHQSYASVEIPMRVASGEVRWFHRSSAQRPMPHGQSVWDGVEIDITDRKRAEEALKEREAELREVLSAASIATFDVDHVTGNVRGSPQLNEIYGYPSSRSLNLQDLRARYHPDDLEEIYRLFAGAADPAVRQFDMEFRLLLPGGVTRWVAGRGAYVRDETGRVVRSRGVVLDITERKHWEERQQLLIHELNHRVKNTLSTVQSIAYQSLRNAATPDQARRDIEGRLIALSRAHDVLTREGWEGASLREIVSQAIEPFGGLGEDRFTVEGEDLRLSPQRALALAMALQELATNAVKYGSLSNESGRVTITATIAGAPPLMRLVWAESGGPTVPVPSRRGFGSRLIERSLAADLGGRADLQFRPDGIVCVIEAPVHRALE